MIQNKLRIKVVILLFVNIVLLLLLYKGYSQLDKFQGIIEKHSPVRVKILNINYHAKSSSTCDIIYNSRIYKNIDISQNKIVLGTNDSDFYYDSENDTIFYKNDGKAAFRVLVVLFVISLLLWLLPSNKFRLTSY